MNRKIIYLFIALMLPGLIFIFLKRFGKNEFDIPVFYQTTADSLNAVCRTHYKSPYRISDSALLQLGWNKKKATVFLFNWNSSGKELNRLSDTFAESEYDLIKVTFAEPDTMKYKELAACVFFVGVPRDLVLMDEQKRIRGYYVSASREEMDRLIVELKILLKKY